MELGDEIFYRLSREDTIVEVGGAWDRFAVANDGQNLLSDRILGQSIYAHVLGEPTRDFVWTMLDGVRKLKRPVRQTYRCDSPGLKRFMQMTIEPEEASGLCLRHRLVSTAPLVLPVQFRAVAPGTARAHLTFRCSCCNRLNVDGAWHDPEQASFTPELKQLIDQGVMRIAYSVCPSCKSGANWQPLDSETRIATTQYR